MTEITIDPAALTLMTLVTAAIVQSIKRVPFISKNTDIVPLVSIVVGGLVGALVSLVFPDVEMVQGVLAGLLASGGFDLLKGTGNTMKKIAQ